MKTTLKQSATLLCGLAMLCGLAFLSSCTSLSKDPTYGTITVDRPEVFTRERLVSRRHNETQWLEKQLNAEYVHKKQAYREVRQLSRLVANLHVKADPLSGELITLQKKNEVRNAKREAEQEEWDHQLNKLRYKKDKLQLKKDIADLKNPPDNNGSDKNSGNGAEPENGNGQGNGDTVESGSTAENTTENASDTTEAEAEVEADADTPAEEDGNTDPDPEETPQKTVEKPSLPDPADMVDNKSELTPIEKLKDEKAYRDMVNAMIRETELDDTHDLMGYSLYTLKFDTTLIPGDNSRTFGQVKLELVDTPSKISDEEYKEIYLNWLDRFQEELDLEVATLIFRAKHNLLTDDEKSALYRTSVRTKMEEREKEAVNKLLLTRPSVMDWRVDIHTKSGICKLMARKYEVVLSDIVDIIPERIIIREPDEKIDLCTVEGKNSVLNKSNKSYSAFKTRYESILKEAKPYIYSVEPKEYAQNISDVAARKELKEYMISLGIVLQQFGVSQLDASLNKMDQSRNLMHSISRKPLAVGYANGRNEFGWIFGPKFHGINEKAGFFGSSTKAEVTYRHTAVQHSFQASVVVPAWWTEVTLKSSTFWLDENGVPIKNQTGVNGTAMKVQLPMDYSALTAALMSNREIGKPMIFPERDPEGNVRRHLVYAIKTGDEKSSDAKTHLVIHGRDLWRNPRVFIGNQQADKITILPDMGGLVAEFDTIRMPPRHRGDQSNPVLDLKIFTSNGMAMVNDAVEILKDDGSQQGEVSVTTASIINGKSETMELSVIPPDVLQGYTDARLLIRPHGIFGVNWKPSGQLQSHTVEKNTKAVLKFKDVKWVSWKDGQGADIKKDAPKKMEALVEVQFQPGALFQKLGKADSAGQFVYFGTEQLSQAAWVISEPTYYLSGTGEDISLTFVDEVALKLGHHDLFNLAYPGLEAALKKPLTLKMTSKNEPPLTDEPLTTSKAITPRIDGDAAIYAIPGPLLATKLKDRLKDGQKHEITWKLAYEKEKELPLQDGGKLVFKPMTIAMDQTEVKYEVSADKKTVTLKNNLEITLGNASQSLLENLKKTGFMLRWTEGDEQLESPIPLKENTENGANNAKKKYTIEFKDKKLTGKESDIINGLFKLLQDGANHTFTVDLKLEEKKLLRLSEPVTFKK